jgi:protein TonB
MPEFPGCEKETNKNLRQECSFTNLMEFLSKNLVYPAAAKASQSEGMVMVTFIINKEGEVTKASVAKGFDAECDAEALRVVQLMPEWNPGVQDGQQVAVHMVLPIRFSL